MGKALEEIPKKEFEQLLAISNIDIKIDNLIGRGGQKHVMCNKIFETIGFK